MNIEINLHNHILKVTVSIGVSVYPYDGKNIDDLLKCCDMAMYAAKEDGENTHRYFEYSMNQRIQKRTNIEHRLRKALINEEFYLVYQPQIDLTNGKITGLRNNRVAFMNN